jgi:hypothetical protein
MTSPNFKKKFVGVAGVRLNTKQLRECDVRFTPM